MKKTKLFALTATIIALSTTTVFAAKQLVYPYGQLGEYPQIALSTDRSPIKERGLYINGQVYVPVEALQTQKKLAYYFDPSRYQAHLFFGGAGGSTQMTQEAQRVVSNQQIVDSLMGSISFDASNYHSGMMLQDIDNIASLAKQLKLTTDSMNKAVYSKLNQNITPNMSLLKQTYAYGTVPLELMQDRMEKLADSLGDNVSSRDERRMEDVMELIDDAIYKKHRALTAFEDWLQSSDEDDLDDLHDYEEEANKDIDNAIKYLTGLDAKDLGDKYKNNLRDNVVKWISKQNK
ncbi:hypothetical protein [Brevibacillus daliensis]|uniref:hypothetical protein n=1 Tax=Brevibacillus daliensis TaxID=2892995 RepID=UPI001E501B8C|nr:hypothetical protein [Brevibacillus daliensis]